MQDTSRATDDLDQSNARALYSARLCMMALSGRHEAVARLGRNATCRCLNCGRQAPDEVHICNPAPRMDQLPSGSVNQLRLPDKA